MILTGRDQGARSGQTSLIIEKRPTRPRGRVERAVADAIVAGRDGERADKRWRGAETLAREIGAAMDYAGRTAKVYAVAQLAPRLLDALRELRLTPGSAGLDADPLTELLSELSAPLVGNPED